MVWNPSANSWDYRPGFLTVVWALTRVLEEQPGFEEVLFWLGRIGELVLLVVFFDQILNNSTGLCVVVIRLAFTTRTSQIDGLPRRACSLCWDPRWLERGH
jgi:hypothetical protein